MRHYQHRVATLFQGQVRSCFGIVLEKDAFSGIWNGALSYFQLGNRNVGDVRVVKALTACATLGFGFLVAKGVFVDAIWILIFHHCGAVHVVKGKFTRFGRQRAFGESNIDHSLFRVEVCLGFVAHKGDIKCPGLVKLSMSLIVGFLRDCAILLQQFFQSFQSQVGLVVFRKFGFFRTHSNLGEENTVLVESGSNCFDKAIISVQDIRKWDERVGVQGIHDNHVEFFRFLIQLWFGMGPESIHEPSNGIHRVDIGAGMFKARNIRPIVLAGLLIVRQISAIVPFGQVLGCYIIDENIINFQHDTTIDRFVLEALSQRGPFSASDNGHALGIGVRQNRRVHQGFVVGFQSTQTTLRDTIQEHFLVVVSVVFGVVLRPGALVRQIDQCHLLKLGVHRVE
mmetsp:Transcript_25971/g.71530  ORF Transcript_25971/g.71530 Transcript_25971/m.71530 type:complete len:397 (+) Transcript_25971:639-1829(+)